ncbi:MAG: DNA translocase FtsK [Lachnospiraceae bacterium]|nr:DNA translocase FtsK [Lachnospiraceae bacterium]
MTTGSSKKKRSGGGSLGRRSTAGRKNTGKKVNRGANDGLLKEIVLITVIAFSALLFLSNLGFIGTLGEFISNILFGVFGYVSYLVPIALVLAAALYVSDRDSTVTSVKFWSGLVLLVILCSFAQLLFFKDDIVIDKITDYYVRCSSLKCGGGILGGSVTEVLNKGVGTVGCIIVLIVLAIIALMLISEKSLIGGVKNGGRTLYDNARNDIERRRLRRENERPLKEEQRRLRNEEKEKRRRHDEEVRQQKVRERDERLKQRDMERLERRMEEKRIREENLRKKEEGSLRMERKVSGVMLDTKLSEEALKEGERHINDDIHEISYEEPGEDFLRNASDDEIREVYASVHEHEKMLRYENASSRHSIAVDPEEIRRKLGDTDEIESAIINEALHISRDYDYDKPLAGDFSYEKYEPEDRYESKYEDKYEDKYEKKYERSYESSDASVNEYMKPSVSVDESSYSSGRGSAPAKRQKDIRKKDFRFPPMSLLKKGAANVTGDSKRVLNEKAENLRKTLEEFGVRVTMTGYTQGPAITRFEMKPDVGVKVSKVLNLSDDIMLSMAAKNVRIEAPIPGKSLIGIELPNEENTAVMFRDLLESQEFKKAESKLSFAVGKGLSGETVVADIGKMPHLLIAGATGSGKSVCINTLIMSILYKARPDEVKLIMIDPKVVELSVYNGIPHLMIPVVTDPKQAAEALKWGVVEMDDRYNKFAEFGVRDLTGYNKKVQSMTDIPEQDRYKVLPRIIIIVDELADLMMVASKEVEESICRIAQKARAAGIHLVIATQRPSVDVVTGLIKANMPSRIAFSVSSGVDSRTILDMVGAEKLLGKGDMLFYPQGYTKPARVQGAFVSDQEVNDVVDFLKEHSGQEGYDEEVTQKIKNASAASADAQSGGGSGSAPGGKDELFVEAAKAIIDKNKASIGMLQRLFKIGFNRAARIMDQLADAGVVGEEEGTKPRKVLMSMEQLENYVEENL